MKISRPFFATLIAAGLAVSLATPARAAAPFVQWATTPGVEKCRVKVWEVRTPDYGAYRNHATFVYNEFKKATKLTDDHMYRWHMGIDPSAVQKTLALESHDPTKLSFAEEALRSVYLPAVHDQVYRSPEFRYLVGEDDYWNKDIPGKRMTLQRERVRVTAERESLTGTTLEGMARVREETTLADLAEADRIYADCQRMPGISTIEQIVAGIVAFIKRYLPFLATLLRL